MVISAEDLPPEVLKKAGIKTPDEEKTPKMVKPQIIALGGVLLALKGLTSRQALWVLRHSNILVRGYLKDKNVPGRKRKTVDKGQ